jgi:2-C-methyl-D-erythritol 4-phosphate cytidylyltransferase
MNIGLIIAAGSGARMRQDIPKQFLNVYDKPIVIYTLEAFQRHPDIDRVAVVCLEGWQDMLWAYAKQYDITKLDRMVDGGASSQESIYKGVCLLEGQCEPDDIIVIHDGIRPLVDASVLSDVIVKCGQYGNGVSSLPYNEQIFVALDENATRKYIPRESLRRVSTPQA